LLGGESAGKSISLCKLCDALCLCGEITRKKIHHRGTEVTQRATETFFLGVEKPDYEQAESKLFDERV